MKRKNLLLIILTIIFIIPINVFASDGETQDLFINIDVNKDGSIFVQELATLEGDYNGRLRSIYYKNLSAPSFSGSESDFEGSDIYNGSSIENLKVYSVNGRNLNFDNIFNTSSRSNEFRLVTYASKGDEGVYERSEAGGGYDLTIYNPSSTDSSFYMEYTIRDAVVIHNDVAELAWNLIGNNYTDNIDNLEAKINLPSTDDDLRVWLHGPLNGSIERQNDKTAYVNFNFVGANNPVSVRLMFDKNITPLATKFSNVEGRNNILSVEKKAADKANAERDKIKKQNGIVCIITIIWYVVLLVAIILFILEKKRLNKCDFDIEYYREFPNTYGPEIVDYLVNKSISDDSLGASILMLIEKKAIKFEPIETDEENAILTRVPENEKDLSESEKLLISFLFDKMGSNGSTTLSTIKEYGKSESKARSFISSYDKWKKSVQTEAVQNKFFLTSNPIQNVLIILGIIGILVAIINYNFETGFVLGYISIAVGVFVFIYAVAQRLRTPYGVDQYKKWMAFKKFIVDFSTFDDKELPEISLWGKYLVYATVLGCAKKLESDMKIRMENMNLDPAVYNTYYYHDHYYMSTVSNSINRTMNRAVSSSRSSIAASSSSSSGGFGGGSSGGGGSFGGGGGGGHF